MKEGSSIGEEGKREGRGRKGKKEEKEEERGRDESEMLKGK